MVIQEILFYAFAVILGFAGLMVITSNNPVRSALFLVLAFVASAGLWLLLQAEFLALILVLVYVGAVMTLFLFVVMMLNLDIATLKQHFVRYLPVGVAAMAAVVVLMILLIVPGHFGTQHIVNHSADYSNTRALGTVLYTHYIYAFEIAGMILLAGIVAAISLALPGVRKRKVQSPGKQSQVRPEDRLRMVKMPAEKKGE